MLALTIAIPWATTMKKHILLNIITFPALCILLFIGCDSTKGSWTVTGSLNHERSAHSATLLRDGRVLIAGGFDLSSKRQTSAELFDPVAGSWAETSPLHIGRAGHTATLLPDGRVLVAGGIGPALTLNNAIEIFDPDDQKWMEAAALNTERFDHTATLLKDGRVLVTGGQNPEGTFINSAEIYDPVSGCMDGNRPDETGTQKPPGYTPERWKGTCFRWI